jgi:hypothetical protein
MGEPEGRTGPGGKPEAGDVLEGQARVDGSAADSAQRDRMPPFRGQYQSTASLDMLADMGEVEALLADLARIAKSHSNDLRWAAFGRHIAAALAELERINAPKPR